MQQIFIETDKEDWTQTILKDVVPMKIWQMIKEKKLTLKNDVEEVEVEMIYQPEIDFITKPFKYEKTEEYSLHINYSFTVVIFDSNIIIRDNVKIESMRHFLKVKEPKKEHSSLMKGWEDRNLEFKSYFNECSKCADALGNLMNFYIRDGNIYFERFSQTRNFSPSEESKKKYAILFNSFEENIDKIRKGSEYATDFKEIAILAERKKQIEHILHIGFNIYLNK